MHNSKYSDEYIDVYYSPVVQADLTERPWYIFHKSDDESLLNKIRAAGVNLDTLADVHQGVVPVSAWTILSLKLFRTLARLQSNEVRLRICQALGSGDALERKIKMIMTDRPLWNM